VGIEDRDWFRDEDAKERSGSANRAVVGTVGALIVLLAIFAASPRGKQLLHLDGAHVGGEGAMHPDVKLTPLLGGPSVRIHKDPLYKANDPWRSYLADEQTCPGGERTDLPAAEQTTVMLCLIDWARKRHGLNAPPQTLLLERTARQKAEEIIRCHNFDHSACGQSPDADVRALGYPGAFGENLYIAGGRFGAPRVALDGWLNSPGHRENLFRPFWRTQGIAIIKLDRFGPYSDMTLWVSQFGSE
jgi:hypothetical protein